LKARSNTGVKISEIGKGEEGGARANEGVNKGGWGQPVQKEKESSLGGEGHPPVCSGRLLPGGKDGGKKKKRNWGGGGEGFDKLNDG